MQWWQQCYCKQTGHIVLPTRYETKHRVSIIRQNKWFEFIVLYLKASPTGIQLGSRISLPDCLTLLKPKDMARLMSRLTWLLASYGKRTVLTYWVESWGDPKEVQRLEKILACTRFLRNAYGELRIMIPLLFPFHWLIASSTSLSSYLSLTALHIWPNDKNSINHSNTYWTCPEVLIKNYSHSEFYKTLLATIWTISSISSQQKSQGWFLEKNQNAQTSRKTVWEPSQFLLFDTYRHCIKSDCWKKTYFTRIITRSFQCLPLCRMQAQWRQKLKLYLIVFIGTQRL